MSNSTVNEPAEGMLHPTINKLTKGKFNRYQLAVATAKCARLITDEYVRERHLAEKNALGVKDIDKTAECIVNPDYRDRKAVKIAIDKIDSGEYVMVDLDNGAMTLGERKTPMTAHQAGAVPTPKTSGAVAESVPAEDQTETPVADPVADPVTDPVTDPAEGSKE